MKNTWMKKVYEWEVYERKKANEWKKVYKWKYTNQNYANKKYTSEKK